jgi:hypothetical protein
MAENAIEILIDVLAQEGIDSTDEFVKVLTSAIDKADVLAGSVDDLDASLTGLSKSGMSAESMAAAMATAMEDAGIQFKDVDGFVTILSKSLTELGAAGEKAAGGIDLTTKANEELIGPTDAATAAVERQGGAVKALGVSAAETEAALKGFRAGAVASAYEADAAVEDLGSGFARMTTLSNMATPALMKAATWAGVGLAGLAYEGIKQYTQFNKLITQTITQAGVAPSKMGFLTNLAESVAKSTGQNLDDVANSIYRAASGTASWNNGLGATKKQLTDIVTQVSKLNVLGNISTGAESEQASRVVTALINSNIRGVGRSPTAAAAFVNAQVGSGDIRMSDLVPAYGRGLLASAKANDMSAIDVASWVDTLTSTGQTGGIAGNYVKTGINLLAHPSAQGVDALAMLGIKPGEMENLISSPGGLVSALSTLKTGMKKLDPSTMAKFFFHEAGAVYPGGSGLTGAVAKLQTWSAGELSPKFIKDWEANKLTSKEQTQATDLILTKAFGGSKQFATIAAVLNNIGLVKGIKSHLIKEDNPAYLRAAEARAEATPAQQFKRMEQNLLVDLVNIGHTLTPLALKFGHIMTGVIDGLSKFKGVIYGFATLAGGLLAAAGISKMATLATHMAPFFGGAYNRLGSMAGQDSAFTRGMTNSADGGGFKLLNIYDAKKRGILSKLGGESIMANGLPADAAVAEGAGAESLSKDGTALNTTGMKQVVLLEKIAVNTGVTSAAVEEGDMTGMGGLPKVGGRGGAAEAEVARGEQLALGTGTLEPGTRFSAAYGGDAIALGHSSDQMINGIPYYMDSRTGKMRARLTVPETPPGSSTPRDASYYRDQNLGGVDMGMGQYGPPSPNPNVYVSDATPFAEDAATTVEKAAVPAAEDLGAGFAETLGGLAGGPMGMMAMMAAPMMIGALSPLIGKLGGLFSHLFGDSAAPVYNPHNKNPLDVTSAATKLSNATKTLRAYQREVKNKAGKETWVNNQSAMLANMPGYIAAHKAYIKAGGENAQALKDANAVDMTAYDYTYGSKHGTLNALEKAALKHSKGLVSHPGLGTPENPDPSSVYASQAQQKSALNKYVASLLTQIAPSSRGNLKNEIWKRVNKNGPGQFVEDYQNIGKMLGAQQSYYKKVFSDASTESAQQLAKNSPAFAAMETGGLFGNSSALKLNRSQMSSFLSDKKIGPRSAAEYLPQYANKYHQIMMTDQKALAAKGADKLTGDARQAFKDQEKEAQASLKKTDDLIREVRAAAKDTKLDGESVQKLAKENASALVASGLPQDIASALAGALSPYLKTSKSGGTGTNVTTANPSPGNLAGVVAAGSAGS